MCEMIAHCVVGFLVRICASADGPTGWARSYAKSRRISAGSTFPSAARKLGIAVLNEESVRGHAPTLLTRQLALYLHVDDGIVLSDGTDSGRANSTMHELADSLEVAGFHVDDRTESAELEKVVGYELERHPARIRFPLRKSVMLQDSLRYLARGRFVHTGVLRSLTGLWIWGALLRREMLCVPHALFRFMDAFEDQLVPWWESARREVFVMASMVGMMTADVGAPLSNCVFAADAMGAGVDCGGFGIVAANVDSATARECLRVGLRPGCSVAKLSGEFHGSRRPDLVLQRATPFTKLPRPLFDGGTIWHLVELGR